MNWEIENHLARSHRPGRWHSGRITKEIIDDWIIEAKSMGILSIICLLEDEQLGLYKALPYGLLSYYEDNGFNVVSIPIIDHKYPPISEQEALEIFEAYLQLPKPVLIHCSAGQSRTGEAVFYIKHKLSEY